MNQVLLYVGALLPLAWGIAHVIPTAGVVRGFGDIGADNRRILTMEWVNEGATLAFIGLLVAAVTAIDHEAAAARATYFVSVGALNALSVISLFTGFRVHFLPFRLCPVIFTGSSLLILAGAVL